MNADDVILAAFNDELEKLGGVRRVLRLMRSSRAPTKALDIATGKLLRRRAGFLKKHGLKGLYGDFPEGRAERAQLAALGGAAKPGWKG